MSWTMEAPSIASASASLIPKRVAIGAGAGMVVGLLFTFVVTYPAASFTGLGFSTAGACFAFLSFHRRLTTGWLAVLRCNCRRSGQRGDRCRQRAAPLLW
jgi:hypothetical protein